jgi:hypothetical protein
MLPLVVFFELVTGEPDDCMKRLLFSDRILFGFPKSPPDIFDIGSCDLFMFPKSPPDIFYIGSCEAIYS